jgi:hypothetical protein
MADESKKAKSADLTTTEYDESDVFAVYSRISWGALFAGAVVALSAFMLLSVLGAAIGLSMQRPGVNDGLDWGATVWAITATLLSLFAGGWVATQCTAGENRMEGAMYGILLWGLVFAILFFFAASGVSTIFSSMLGVANVVSEQQAVDFERLTRGVTELTAEQREQMRQNMQQALSSETAVEAAWWTFGAMALSMLAAVCGAVMGAGPSPMFRAWVIQARGRRGQALSGA